MSPVPADFSSAKPSAAKARILRDKNLDRFMLKVDARAELALRDVVAQAIFRQMEITRHPNVYLDLRHLDPALVRKRFPGIAKVCRGFGLDITTDLIPDPPRRPLHDRRRHRGHARPHHAARIVGRRRSDFERFARRQPPGLQQPCSKASSTAPPAAKAPLPPPSKSPTPSPPCRSPAASNRKPTATSTLPTSPIRCAASWFGKWAWCATKPAWKQAKKDVAFWCRYVLPREFDNRTGWELQNLLTIARLMIHSALERRESRGVHLRADFPERDDVNWGRHIVCPAFDERVA